MSADQQSISNRGAFTIDEFCQWARVGRTIVYQEIKAGRLKVRKVGRRTLIARIEAERWLNDLPF